MALEITKNVVYASGLTLPIQNAYIRIDSYKGNNKRTTIYTNSYLSRQDFYNGKEPLEPTREYIFNFDESETSPNIIKQGYNYLKTLSEFENANDVLEEGQVS